MGSHSLQFPSLAKGEAARRQLEIRRHGPGAVSGPVAQVTLPESNKDESTPSQPTTIFPQMAAFRALESITNSPEAREIALFDPTGTSLAATRLAQDAIATAHRQHDCTLTRAQRARDRRGAVTATYTLAHPTLGACPVTVSKSALGPHDVRAKICLHHPAATPAAVGAETLVLAFLDFARDACVLDVPSLLALEAAHLVDVAVTTLLAVATAENDALIADALTFAAPPTKALEEKKTKMPRGAKGAPSRRHRFVHAAKTELLGEGYEQVRLPLLTRGALSLAGLSFKAAVLVAEVGFKVTAGAVVGAARIAKKM